MSAEGIIIGFLFVAAVRFSYDPFYFLLFLGLGLGGVALTIYDSWTAFRDRQ